MSCCDAAGGAEQNRTRQKTPAKTASRLHGKVKDFILDTSDRKITSIECVVGDDATAHHWFFRINGHNLNPYLIALRSDFHAICAALENRRYS